MKKDEKPLISDLSAQRDGRGSGRINADPFGSYTGRPADPYEKPVQDADDL